MNISDPDMVVPLTPHMLYILLALAFHQDNAYGLMRAVAEDSAGTVILTSGTLYPLLKRMLSMNYITEIATRPASGPTRTSKIYRLSSRGSQVLIWELDRYRRAAILGQKRLRNRVQ